LIAVASIVQYLGWAADSQRIENERALSMAKKTLKLPPWTKEDVRTLKTLARKKSKTTAIARTLKRTVGATRQQAFKLGVSLGER
jgi:hypothetical protein